MVYAGFPAAAAMEFEMKGFSAAAAVAATRVQLTNPSLAPVLIQTAFKVDQVVASLEEMRCTIAGLRRRNRPRSSKHTRYDRLNEANGKMEATWEEEPNHRGLMLEGAWRNWSPAANEVHGVVMEIQIASRFAKKLATFVADALHKETVSACCCSKGRRPLKIAAVQEPEISSSSRNDEKRGEYYRDFNSRMLKADQSFSMLPREALHRFKILFPREEAPAAKTCCSRPQAAATHDRPLLNEEVSPSPPLLLKHHRSALNSYDERGRHLQQLIGLWSAILGVAPRGLCKAHGPMVMTRQLVTNKLCNVPEAMTEIDNSNSKPWKPRHSCKGMMLGSSSSLIFPAGNLHVDNQARHVLCETQSPQLIESPPDSTTKLVMDDPSSKMNRLSKLLQSDERNNKPQGIIRMHRFHSSSSANVETSVQPSVNHSQVVVALVNGKENHAQITGGSHKTSGMWLLRSWSLLHHSSAAKTTSGFSLLKRVKSWVHSQNRKPLRPGQELKLSRG